MTLDAYRQIKSGGGKLKLRALALLAEGGADAAFNAATLLREAARLEDRALRLLSTPDAEERLGVAVERCGCFVDARAPTAAAVAWGEVLVAGDALPEDVVRSYRSKLDRVYESLQRAHQRALAGAPILRAAGFLWPAARDKARAHRELEKLLVAFPGELELWYMRYQASFFDDDDPGAWAALQKARALEPDNAFAIGAELLLIPRVLSAPEAERRLDAAYSALRRVGADIEADTYLCFAVASLSMAERGEGARLHHERALEAAERGAETRLDLTRAKADLRIVRVIARDLLAGRTPTLDAFYRAGRGDLVARASADDRRNPLRILTRSFQRALEPLPRAA
jgi:hypothetical protein